MKNTSNKLESLGLSAVRIIFLFTGRRGLSNLVEIFLPYLLSRKRGFAVFFCVFGDMFNDSPLYVQNEFTSGNNGWMTIAISLIMFKR